MRNLRTRVGAVALCAVAASTGVAGCKSGGAQPSDLCKSIAGLSSSVSSLTTTQVSQTTLPGLKVNLKQANQQMKNLKGTSGSKYSSEIAAIDATMTKVNSTVATALKAPTPANRNAARASLDALAKSTKNLTDAASSSC